jgi:uncharacterized protein with PQ loop repeat
MKTNASRKNVVKNAKSFVLWFDKVCRDCFCFCCCLLAEICLVGIETKKPLHLANTIVFIKLIIIYDLILKNNLKIPVFDVLRVFETVCVLCMFAWRKTISVVSHLYNHRN